MSIANYSPTIEQILIAVFSSIALVSYIRDTLSEAYND